MTPTSDQIRDHLVNDVLAWWMTNGPDVEHGGVLTCWDNRSATLVADQKYTWSQGRWAWLTAMVAASAAQLGVDPAPYREQALSAARFVRDHALLPDGTTAFVTTRAGEPLPQPPGSALHTSVFADFFAVLGWAGAHRLEPDAGWGDLALRILLSGEQRVRAGAFRSEPYPVPTGHRSFGLPMILVGAGEQVYRATGSPEAARVVQEASHEIADVHLVGNDIVEMPRDDGSDGDGLLVRHRTPGHTLEAVWFLDHARELLTGALANRRVLAQVAKRALEVGWDSDHGGLLRYVDRDGGRPRGERSGDRYASLVANTWDTKLWWPHAEAWYAASLLAEDPELATWADRIADFTWRVFPEGPGREWTQIRDRTGNPLDQTVALPVKDPFHIARALLLLTTRNA